tara:strand:+ start:3950 stop:4141 length:192 start_codon:yes stop_codon:yes gene_type:complete
MFREACLIVGYDHNKIASRMKLIASMPLRIRRDLIHNKLDTLIDKVISDADEVSGGGEAERKG